MICSVLANSNRDPKKRRKPFTLSDFLPQMDGAESDSKARRHQSAEDMVRGLKAIKADVKSRRK